MQPITWTTEEVQARPRDGQRSRVYAWERAASKDAVLTPIFQTLGECQSFVTPIWNAER